MRAKIKQANFLVEIHTEELPSKALLPLAQSFLQTLKKSLSQAELAFTEAVYYAAPRRLAVSVSNLIFQQKESVLERKGPALAAAYDAEGNPTAACKGFARSCGACPQELIILKNPQGEWVGHRQTILGKTVYELLPEIVEHALTVLQTPTKMRWHESLIEFVRPVHSVILLYGSKIIPGNILGLPTGNKTRGHRFHSKGFITISHADRYLSILEKHFVIADFARRKQMIRAQVDAIILKYNPMAHAQMQEPLLDEITGLVEWPIALYGEFNKYFLSVPQEALISAMQDHQRYFPLLDQQEKLLPYFIIISNIDSKNKPQVIEGNERVLRARLSDAAFFFNTDKKQPLAAYLEMLKTMVYHAKLGTLFDKAQRLAKLTAIIANPMGLSTDQAGQAGLLAKADLCTQLVGEFPELQGIAGRYYALNNGTAEEIAEALYEQYLPKFSGDRLPKTPLGQALALADRADALVGIFGMNQRPTGDKDPSGLRRAALGLLRILIEQKINLDLPALLMSSVKTYAVPLENDEVVQQILNFMLERLKVWYQEKGISTDVFLAVAALKLHRPYDFHLRIQAVNQFKKLPQAEALSIANKRVSHILNKYSEKIMLPHIDESLFELPAEKKLAEELNIQQKNLSPQENYSDTLTKLAELRDPIDHFFKDVLVMTDNIHQRENRLLLLKKLRELFLHVADIGLLQ